jgi:hypothetical protein
VFDGGVGEGAGVVGFGGEDAAAVVIGTDVAGAGSFGVGGGGHGSGDGRGSDFGAFHRVGDFGGRGWRGGEVFFVIVVVGGYLVAVG